MMARCGGFPKIVGFFPKSSSILGGFPPIFGNTHVFLKASGTGGGTAFKGTASEEDFDGTASSAASAIRLHVCH